MGLQCVKLTSLDKYKPKKYKISDLENKYKPIPQPVIPSFKDMNIGHDIYNTYDWNINYRMLCYIPTKEELHSLVPEITDKLKEECPFLFND